MSSVNRPDGAWLPWNGHAISRYEPAGAFIADGVAPEFRVFLPDQIVCCSDPRVPEADVQAFLRAVPVHLNDEIRKRQTRIERFRRVFKVSEARIFDFVTGRRHRQPWALLYSEHGGFDQYGTDGNGFGLIPCSMVRHHGVAWRRGKDGSVRTWLATAREEGKPWDFDSDIGHESAHAAFAHVPLFAQDIQAGIGDAPFAVLKDVSAMRPGDVARFCYFFVELAVTVIRGERRDTSSGLPIVGADEVVNLLAVADELMPKAGFQRALSVAYARQGRFDVEFDDEVFLLLQPAMELIERLSNDRATFVSPSLHWFMQA